MSQPIVLPPAIPQPLNSPQGLRVPALPLNQQGPLPVRMSPNVMPGSPMSRQRAPVGATFSGIGEMSVSDAVRMQKDSYLATGGGLPISGPDYVQKIRKDAAGDLYVAPPSMPTAGYAAAFYNRPSAKMRVGAALQGAPFRGGTIPAWAKKSQYYIPQSPAEHRKAQMATLMGLGAIDMSKVQVGGERTFGVWVADCCVPGENCATGEYSGEEGNKNAKIIGVREKFSDLFGFDPTDEQVMYYAAMKWCVYPNSFNAGDREKNFVNLIVAIAQKWNDAGRDRNNKALITPGPDQFPGGLAAFNDSFAQRNSNSGFKPGEALKFVNEIVSTVTGTGTGTGTGTTTTTTDKCAVDPTQQGCPGYVAPAAEEKTDYMPIIIGVAAVAVIFLGYQAMKKQKSAA